MEVVTDGARRKQPYTLDLGDGGQCATIDLPLAHVVQQSSVISY